MSQIRLQNGIISSSAGVDTRINATSSLYIDVNEVGINTIPAYALDVSGVLNLSSSLLAIAGNTGSNGQILGTSGGAASWMSEGSAGTGSAGRDCDPGS